MLDGYLPKFQNVQPFVEWSVRTLTVVNLDVTLLGVAVQGGAVDLQYLAGLGDGVPSCWVDVRLRLRHLLPPFSSLRPELPSFLCLLR